ncbi:HdeD family acid-resistance protein [Tautonia marina]|uniref:HdeD family acid-resistance protein n=1 Tax=Tautonia marina TaxID=2653855 RepID=UPI001260D983|nr:HdeD family acid-resistance protein [Tautonia marina]
MSDPIVPGSSPLRTIIRNELSEIRANWVGFLVLGVVLIVLGSLLIGVPWIGTLAAVWMLSILLILSGITQFVAAFWVRRWSGFFLALLAGVLYAVVGILIVDHPTETAEFLTLIIAAFLIIGGVFRIAVALSLKFEGWGWTLAGGVLSTLLGLLIWRQWPEASLWVIGLFVGLEVLFTGWTWVMLALLLRRLPKAS